VAARLGALSAGEPSPDNTDCTSSRPDCRSGIVSLETTWSEAHLLAGLRTSNSVLVRSVSTFACSEHFPGKLDTLACQFPATYGRARSGTAGVLSGQYYSIDAVRVRPRADYRASPAKCRAGSRGRFSVGSRERSARDEV